MAGRQGREELIKKGLLEMMEQGKWAHHPGQAAGTVGRLTRAREPPRVQGASGVSVPRSGPE